MLSISPREFPADGEDTPLPQVGALQVFSFGCIYLLDIKVEVYRAIFFIKLNVTHENVKWCALGDLLIAISCDVMG